jgi:pyridoxamine 5'-phosphate oxidase
MMTNTPNDPLDVSTVDPNPFTQLKLWLDAAYASGIEEANAMSVATATREGRPSARMVLMRGLDERGLVFYTNYESRKGGELAANPYAALLFYWPPLGRQVRIEGPVARVPAAESDAYFHSRPAGSRISALASRQSEVIESRAVLEARVRELERLHGDQPPRPDYWGGYRVAPELFEFWQSGAYRLHDRIRYSRDRMGGAWWIERLSP